MSGSAGSLSQLTGQHYVSSQSVTVYRTILRQQTVTAYMTTLRQQSHPTGQHYVSSQSVTAYRTTLRQQSVTAYRTAGSFRVRQRVCMPNGVRLRRSCIGIGGERQKQKAGHLSATGLQV